MDEKAGTVSVRYIQMRTNFAERTTVHGYVFNNKKNFICTYSKKVKGKIFQYNFLFLFMNFCKFKLA